MRFPTDLTQNKVDSWANLNSMNTSVIVIVLPFPVHVQIELFEACRRL